MNICIITPRYPYKKNMEFVFVKKLVDEWAKMGHKCVVITDFSLTTFLRRRIEFRPIHYRYIVDDNCFVDVYNPRSISTRLRTSKLSIDLWMETIAFERQIRKLGIDFDFFYCHFFYSSYKVFRYAQRRTIPLFVASGESNLSNRGALERPFPSFRIEDYKHYINGVIAVSTKNKEEALELGLIDDGKCEVFPNGTDLSIFHRLDINECRQKLQIPKNVCVISCVGYFCDRKGQNRIQEAVKKLGFNDVRLIFIGKSDSKENISLKGEYILFKGSVDNKKLPIYLCASDFFCLPTRAEGCCNAIIEAIACGLPVISSNRSFNWDVLDESNSILVDPDNVEEISNAISSLYFDKELRTRLSEGALKKAESLSLHSRAKAIISFIESRL